MTCTSCILLSSFIKNDFQSWTSHLVSWWFCLVQITYLHTLCTSFPLLSLNPPCTYLCWKWQQQSEASSWSISRISLRNSLERLSCSKTVHFHPLTSAVLSCDCLLAVSVSFTNYLKPLDVSVFVKSPSAVLMLHGTWVWECFSRSTRSTCGSWLYDLELTIGYNVLLLPELHYFIVPRFLKKTGGY